MSPSLTIGSMLSPRTRTAKSACLARPAGRRIFSGGASAEIAAG